MQELLLPTPPHVCVSHVSCPPWTRQGHTFCQMPVVHMPKQMVDLSVTYSADDVTYTPTASPINLEPPAGLGARCTQQT